MRFGNSSTNSRTFQIDRWVTGSPSRHTRAILGSSQTTVEPQMSGGRDMKTSLGIWALGPMVTRFVPGGYKPQRVGETTAARVRQAVEGLGDLIDGYEFHYP